MGIDPISIGLILSGVSAVVGVVGNVAAANAANNAAGQQKEANNVANAQQQINSIDDRRQRIREERIRRARIMADAANVGTNGSSGEAGAVGALDTNLAGLVAQSSGQGKANAGINTLSQSAADFNNQAQFISGIAGGIQNGLDRFQTIFDQKPKASDQDIFQ